MYVPKNEVVNILREEYALWIANLTEEEKFAIRKYTYNSFEDGPTPFFKRLNMMLRGEYNKADIQVLANYAEIISKAICKHPLQHDIICYRGMDINPIEGYEVGTKFSFDQFVSTSVVRRKALKKKFFFRIKVPKGANGAYIEKLSIIPGQREFLLDNHCTYKLLSVQEGVIELEVIT